MNDDFNFNQNSYHLPGKNLPDSTREKLRQRKYRARLSNLSKVVDPLKNIGFFLLLISLGYLAVVQLRHLFFGTSYFEIKSIEVAGNKVLSREEVIKTSGISPACNVFLLDKDSLQKRLLQHPRIRKATADLQGLYTLQFKVTEREPVLYAKVGTAFYEISDDGVIISTESLGEKDLPIITGLKLDAFRAGESLKEDDAYFIAQNWIKNLDKKILSTISEINFSNPHNPYLYLISGEKVFPRNLEDLKKRYNFLRALLDNLRKNNVEPIYLDMRAPSIVVRPRKKTGASEGSRGSVAGG